jgi:hypothetical protein
MNAPMNYSQILRVIGQALEPLHPELYEVVCYGDLYLVRCRIKEEEQDKKVDEKKVRRFPSFLRLWREEEKPSNPETPPYTMNVEFLYSLDDLRRQDEDRKAPRQNQNEMPDPYSFSNILRTIGDFLDRKRNAKLLFASNHGQEITILYETGQGVRSMEQYSISTLYDIWVKKYVKKRK